MGDALPSGTVTMLFSDIEGSTRLLGRLGPRYAEVLSAQRSILRSVFDSWHGREMGTEGDSFFVVFSSAGDAVSASVAAQQGLDSYEWPSGLPVRVRMGLHTGEPVRHEDGYVGMDVHLAARVAATAHGGQVVLSAATAHLVGERLPEGVRLVDLGLHRLKDIDQPERIHQLAVPGLETTFPPLKSLGTTTSLPTATTSLFGRDGEMRELAALLSKGDVRLVTLTGPGGSGKTRLAASVAARIADLFPDGVYFVPLATVTTAEVMLTTVAETLGVQSERTHRGLLEQVQHLRALFVLDNLEQLPAAADVVSDLLAATRDVVLVATSRRPLHVSGEHEHPVPTLEVPREGALDDATTAGAVQMFVRHVSMVRPGFALTDDNTADVVEVCRRLDGLPLALELAAARTKLLSPRALLNRLDRGLDPGTGSTNRPGRQQTLRAAVEWSYDLLDDQSRSAFLRLGVFAGGCDLEAVAAVAAGSDDPLEQVAELVDASLITVEDGADGEPRLGMLQTIRRFALERLEAEGGLDLVRLRHAQHYLGLVESLAPRLHGPEHLPARGRLETEQDNIREALDWSLPPDSGEVPADDRLRIGQRMASSLRWFWIIGNYRNEAYRWYQRATRSDSEVGPELAASLFGLATMQSELGKAEDCRSILLRSLQMWRELGDDGCISEVLSFLALEENAAGRTDEADAMLDESLELARGIGDNLRLGRALSSANILEGDRGNFSRAVSLVEESRRLAHERGDERSVVLMGNNLADTLLQAGRSDEASLLLPELASGALRMRDAWAQYYVIETSAEVAGDLGEFELATRLFAASDVMLQRLGGERGGDFQTDACARILDRVHKALGPAAWEAEYAAGRSRSPEAALIEVRQWLGAGTRPGRTDVVTSGGP